MEHHRLCDIRFENDIEDGCKRICHCKDLYHADGYRAGIRDGKGYRIKEFKEILFAQITNNAVMIPSWEYGDEYVIKKKTLVELLKGGE